MLIISLNLVQTTKYQRHLTSLVICPKLMINLISFLCYHICVLGFSWVAISLQTIVNATRIAPTAR